MIEDEVPEITAFSAIAPAAMGLEAITAGPSLFAPAAHFAPPLSADSLADALVAGQLSPRTRRAYASDLTELLAVLEA